MTLDCRLRGNDGMVFVIPAEAGYSARQGKSSFIRNFLDSLLRANDENGLLCKGFTVINSMPPLGVFNRIKNDIAKEEARQYIVRVLNAKRDFVNF